MGEYEKKIAGKKLLEKPPKKLEMENKEEGKNRGLITDLFATLFGLSIWFYRSDRLQFAQ